MPVVFSSTERNTILNRKLTTVDLAGKSACIGTRQILLVNPSRAEERGWFQQHTASFLKYSKRNK